MKMKKSKGIERDIIFGLFIGLIATAAILYVVGSRLTSAQGDIDESQCQRERSKFCTEWFVTRTKRTQTAYNDYMRECGPTTPLPDPITIAGTDVNADDDLKESCKNIIAGVPA